MLVMVMPWDQRIKRRFKLRELDILIAVAEAGGMAKAASHLHMSQPAVSKAIADLEHTLKVRLVDRSRQGVEPTDYGLALIKRGVAVFDELRRESRTLSSSPIQPPENCGSESPWPSSTPSSRPSSGA